MYPVWSLLYHAHGPTRAAVADQFGGLDALVTIRRRLAGLGDCPETGLGWHASGPRYDSARGWGPGARLGAVVSHPMTPLRVGLDLLLARRGL